MRTRSASADMSGDYSVARALRNIRLRVFLTMLFERMWPLLLPALLVVALFAVTSWFGLFALMPRWLHIASLSLFAVAGLVALCLPAGIRVPREEEVDQRVEAINGLLHAPLAAQNDYVVKGANDPFAAALWQEHQRRMRAQLQNLQTAMPRPRIPERDPWGLRAVVALLFVTSFAYGFGERGGRIGDAFDVPAGDSGPVARIDAWVTPPRYTGRPPIFLTASTDNAAAKPITVPQGSVISVRIIGGGSEKLVATDDEGTRTDIAVLSPDDAGDDKTVMVEKPLNGARDFRYNLQTEQVLTLSNGRILAKWPFSVTPDTPPQIHFTKEPGHAVNGTLELSYSIEDDYGAAKAFVEIVPVEKDETETLPLYTAPELSLSLPRRGAKDGSTAKDLTAHPWAGREVQLTLVAVDDAGQEGRSETRTMILPERPFSNPLARAVIEQRHILALDALQRDHVLDMLDGVMLRPADTIRNAAHFLGLRSVRTRLLLSETDDQLRDVVSAMWDVARGIEDGNLTEAEKRLRQAQEALKQALQNGASQEEIAKLSAELRKAMQGFLREFAQRQQNNKQAQTPNANAQTLTEKDLQRMMDQIENLARQGSRDQAQQLLSQLENLMNNLQMGQGQQQGGRGQQGQSGNAMQNQMNRLGELMQRQQKMMNDTFQLDQQMQRQYGDSAMEGEEGEEDGLFPGQPEAKPPVDNKDQPSPQELTDAMRKLQDGQNQLKSDLQKLMDDLKGMGLEAGKEFDEAGKSMGKAGEALGRSEGAQANDDQGEALDALRRGGRDMMKKMQEAMGEGAQSAGQSGAGKPGARDPLGRQQGSTGPDFGDGVKVPGEIDIQRARQILDEIRRRLGNALSPQMEKDYLERLLKFD